MRYSLLNRFQGALLGTALGEIIGTKGTSDLTLTRCPELTKSSPDYLQTPHAVGFGDVIVAVAETLIEGGSIDKHLWPQFEREGGQDRVKIAVMLPLLLFFHETELKRQLQIENVAQSFSSSRHFQLGISALGYGISLALKEQLIPQALIPKTSAYLQQTPFHTGASNFIEQLEQVQMLLEQRAGLEMTVKILKQMPNPEPACLSIVLAFYCVLSTPENWQLSVLRAAATGIHPPLTCALTGLLSGAYNSLAGIPGNTYHRLDRSTFNHNPWETLWGVQSVTEILHLARRLFAAWSGIYNLIEPWQTDSMSAIVAPHVLRPR